MTTTEKKPNFVVFLWIIGCIVLSFVGYIFINEYTLQVWEEIFLETRPVDPRDLLRGDYVILRYTIETDKKVIEFLSLNTLQQWDTFYIILWKDTEDIGYVQDVSLEKPSKQTLYIRTQLWKSWWWWDAINLGIWKYFVPEWTGRNIERVRSDMKVLIKVDSYGTAKIVELYYKWEKINPKTFTP